MWRICLCAALREASSALCWRLVYTNWVCVCVIVGRVRDDPELIVQDKQFVVVVGMGGAQNRCVRGAEGLTATDAGAFALAYSLWHIIAVGRCNRLVHLVAVAAPELGFILDWHSQGCIDRAHTL